jgi:hypothetical protein
MSCASQVGPGQSTRRDPPQAQLLPGHQGERLRQRLHDPANAAAQARRSRLDPCPALAVQSRSVRAVCRWAQSPGGPERRAGQREQRLGQLGVGVQVHLGRSGGSWASASWPTTAGSSVHSPGEPAPPCDPMAHSSCSGGRPPAGSALLEAAGVWVGGGVQVHLGRSWAAGRRHPGQWRPGLGGLPRGILGAGGPQLGSLHPRACPLMPPHATPGRAAGAAARRPPAGIAAASVQLGGVQVQALARLGSQRRRPAGAASGSADSHREPAPRCTPMHHRLRQRDIAGRPGRAGSAVQFRRQRDR